MSATTHKALRRTRTLTYGQLGEKAPSGENACAFGEVSDAPLLEDVQEDGADRPGAWGACGNGGAW